ncbi:MAG: aldehyde ferredoxin oxidoreductase N-terminal domain-containing protein [Sutterella wadsworthensis]
MSENKKYGYTGKGLRVDLTTGKITVEPTFPRFDGYIGGTAFGYKVFWDEVPPETDCYAPENKLVIAPGPLSGTGAICSGRTAITTLWPTAWPRSLIASAHVGGELAHKLKFAGWDFVIIEGEAKSPVYLYIHNEKVEIRDASAAWGQGTRRSAEVLAKETTPEASFGVIGQAGENLVPMSNMMVDKSHSAGGLGSVMGKAPQGHRRLRQPGHPHPRRSEGMGGAHRLPPQDPRRAHALYRLAQAASDVRVPHACEPLVRLPGRQVGCRQSARHAHRRGHGPAQPQPHRLPHLLVRVLHGPDDVELHGAQHGLLRLPDPLLLRDPRR